MVSAYIANAACGRRLAAINFVVRGMSVQSSLWAAIMRRRNPFSFLVASLLLILISGRCFPQSSGLNDCVSGDASERRLAICSQIIDAAPNLSVKVKALLARGRLYSSLKRNPEAIADFSALISLQPKIAGYYDDRQAAYKAAGQMTLALNDADEAIRLAPRAAFVYHSRASLLLEMGRPAEAVRDFQTAIVLDPGPAFRYYDLGRAQNEIAQYSEAKSNLDQALLKSPDFHLVRKARAVAEQHLGDPDSAALDIRTYLEREPNDQEALALLSAISGKGAPRRRAARTPISLPTPALRLVLRCPVRARWRC